MTTTWTRMMGWAATALAACAIGACGGGGGGGSSSPMPAGDARNGTYQMYAADARAYTLALDFDAKTWRIAGNGADASGTFSASGTGFVFDPVGTAPAVNNARFAQADDAVTGAFRFAGGPVPFVAARSFATTIADVAGAWKFLVHVADSAGPANSLIFTGEIVAPNQIRLCNDTTIFTIAACPAASVDTGTVSVEGDQFRATFAGGSYPFRVARIGGDKVFLRASISGGTTSRFMVGLDQAAGFADGTFVGVNTAGQATTTTFTAGNVSSALLSEANVASSRSGPVFNVGVPGLQSLGTGDGNLFAMRSSTLAFIVAARANPTVPGYVEIGRR